MRFLRGFICTALALAGYNPACADSTVDYKVGGGWTSNIFQDPSDISAAFSEAKLGLRGSLALEDSHLAYALSAAVRRVPKYRFADQRVLGLELGYSHDLSKTVKLTLKGGVEHRRTGDIFLDLPGALIGYRKADIVATASAGITVDRWGGRNHLTATVSKLDRGKAHFTLRGLKPTQLEAGYTLFDLTGGHIRPLLGGEVGATLQYRASQIASSERRAFERFPAETLRGSLAYGRVFGKSLTLMAEAGVVGVQSPHLGKTVDKIRPSLKGELTWQLPHQAVLKAKIARDIQLADIDDALGEDVRTVGLSLEKALTEKLKLALAYEQAYSDWLYYDYRTRTKSISATLSYAFSKSATASLEYSHLVRRENDKAADFEVDGLAARFSGSF
ncbi:outer membrane beta-barrel protein [Shinella sp.]|uniref:outer membrane beta-barrel protein n=1 Tax=Shinella sp. TaxID=1870904 RepID=UPI0029B2701A|nr:outer membrane beta-barrel protein [Shinella sp.]MDX3976515.1 outer membrane beta-barrel protein [Shinella sp.]